MMKNRIYLVTGAAGNLGGNICRQLLEKGERVRALVLPNDPTEKYLPKEIEIVHGDLLDVPSLEEFFRTKEEDEVYVIHCAAIVWEKMEMNPKVRAVNVDGTANIIEQCLKNRVRKLVYVGSTGAIPELPAGQKIREVDCFLPTEGLVATQEYNGARLYACIVQDATACCSQGLEFEMAEELVYPDDYPDPGTEITVVGTFDSYKEEIDGNYYIYLVLKNARFV